MERKLRNLPFASWTISEQQMICCHIKMIRFYRHLNKFVNYAHSPYALETYQQDPFSHRNSYLPDWCEKNCNFGWAKASDSTEPVKTRQLNGRLVIRVRGKRNTNKCSHHLCCQYAWNWWRSIETSLFTSRLTIENPIDAIIMVTNGNTEICRLSFRNAM